MSLLSRIEWTSSKSPYPSMAVLAGAVVFALLIPLGWESAYSYSFFTSVVMWCGLSATWNVFSGSTRYFSLGHAAFFGIGAYTTGLLVPHLGIWWALAAAPVVTALCGLIVGWVSLQVTGFFFTMATLGFTVVLQLITQLAAGLTGGGSGLTIIQVPSVSTLYYVGLGCLAIVLLATLLLGASRHGRRLAAIGDDEEALESTGVATGRYKLLAFAGSVGFAGLFGGIYAYQVGYLDPTSVFPLVISLTVVIMVMLGGIGTFWGPIVGAIVLAIGRQQLWARFPSEWDLALGGVLMLIVLAAPSGILGLITSRLPLGRRSML